MREQNIVPAIAVQIESDAFSKGFVEGLTGVFAPGEFPRFPIERPPTESDIVEIVRNLTEIAQEGWLTDELLRHDTGLIAGWLSRPASA